MKNNYRVSEDGIKMLVEFEGEILKVYKDPIGLPTLGVGHLVTAAEKKDYPVGKRITRAESRRFLREDLKRFEDAVNSLVTVPITQNQFDALVSLAFNIGEGGFKRSSVLRNLNNRRFSAAADAFLAWNKAGGKALEGLTRRRQTERSVFLTPDPESSAAVASPVGKSTDVLFGFSDEGTQVNPGGTAAQPPIEPGAKVEITDGNIKAETNVPPSQNVVIEKEKDPEPEKPKGFFGALWAKIMAALTAVGGTDVAIEKAQQAQTLGISNRTWGVIFWIVVTGLAIWILYHFVTMKVIPWAKWILSRIRTHKLMAANSTATNNVVVAELTPERIKELEAAGWLVVRRS